MVYMLNISITKTCKISYYDGSFEHFPCQYSQAFTSYVLGCFIWCIHIQNYICLVNLSFHRHILFFFFFALRSVLSDITIATLALSWIVFAHNVLFYFFKKLCSFSHFLFPVSLHPYVWHVSLKAHATSTNRIFLL